MKEYIIQAISPETIAAFDSYNAPQLIRCKDCENSKHWYGDRRRCFLWHESGIDVFDDGFCNYGKRKKVRTKTEKT